MQQNHEDDAKIKDPRVNRTESLLRDALIGLLEENRFEAITVGQIAQRAKINRSTFYRHYEDKYDFAANIIEAAFKELVSDLEAPEIQNNMIDLEQRYIVWVKLFRHVAEHARLYRALLGKTRDPWIMTRMRKFGENLVRYRLQTMRPAHGESDLPEEVAIAFAIELLLGVIGWWLEGNTHYSAEQIATWFVQFISLGYFHALGFEVKS